MKKLWKKRLAYFVQIDLFVSMLSIILKLWLMFWKYFLNKRDHLYKIGQFSVFFFFFANFQLYNIQLQIP